MASALSATEHRSLCASMMMERLGIDPSGGVVPRLSLLYATALHRCESCLSTQACRDWLDSTPGSLSFAPPFCPIGDILSELQFRQLKRTVSAAGQGEIAGLQCGKAAALGMTTIALTAALLTSHRLMPDIVPQRDERREVIAHILSLK